MTMYENKQAAIVAAALKKMEVFKTIPLASVLKETKQQNQLTKRLVLG